MEPSSSGANYWHNLPAIEDRLQLWSNRWNDRLAGETVEPRGNLPQFRSVYYRSHMTWARLEPGPPMWESGDCLSYGTLRSEVTFAFLTITDKTERSEQCSTLLPEGRGFETPKGSMILTDLADPSSCNRPWGLLKRTDYHRQKSKWFLGEYHSRYASLTTPPPSVDGLSRHYVILNISQPYRLSRPVTVIALLS
jgi:hypothetical protein